MKRILYADRIHIFKNIVYIYDIVQHITKPSRISNRLKFQTLLPPRLASSQAVWPWLDPTRGHCRHVATGSKFGSIRILSIIAYSCQIPCQASFHPHVYIYIHIYMFVPGSGSPLPPPMVMAPLSPVAWEV